MTTPEDAEPVAVPGGEAARQAIEADQLWVLQPLYLEVYSGLRLASLGYYLQPPASPNPLETGVWAYGYDLTGLHASYAELHLSTPSEDLNARLKSLTS